METSVRESVSIAPGSDAALGGFRTRLKGGTT